jgi:hypothetical protein
MKPRRIPAGLLCPRTCGRNGQLRLTTLQLHPEQFSPAEFGALRDLQRLCTLDALQREAGCLFIAANTRLCDTAKAHGVGCLESEPAIVDVLRFILGPLDFPNCPRVEQPRGERAG